MLKISNLERSAHLYQGNSDILKIMKYNKSIFAYLIELWLVEFKKCFWCNILMRTHFPVRNTCLCMPPELHSTSFSMYCATQGRKGM